MRSIDFMVTLFDFTQLIFFDRFKTLQELKNILNHLSHSLLSNYKFSGSLLRLLWPQAISIKFPLTYARVSTFNRRICGLLGFLRFYDTRFAKLTRVQWSTNIEWKLGHRNYELEIDSCCTNWACCLLNCFLGKLRNVFDKLLAQVGLNSFSGN